MPRKRTIDAPPGFLGCTKCRQIKPASDFLLCRGRPASYCKVCKVEYNRNLPRSRTITERFWAKVDKDRVGAGCWIWTGAKRGDGYGLFWTGGGSLESAHRVSLELHGIKLPPSDEMVVDHMCYDHACVNPAHLRIVTERDNTYTYARRATKPRKAA